VFTARLVFYNATLTGGGRLVAEGEVAARGCSAGTGEQVGLITEQAGAFEEYEAVALAQSSLAASPDTVVFLRRSARPSRRAVLHLVDLRGSFAPADMARWYNERGFHFYVTDLDVGETIAQATRRRSARSAQAGFAVLDAARQYLREAGGIDAIILSADGPAAQVAARWCDARRAVRPVDALILSDPEFGRVRGRLRIGCPVLVMSAASGHEADAGSRRREHHSHGDVSLGQHVTWLDIGDPAIEQDARRRLFDEMGRWLGAYMYGQVRDQLL
jgi:hypothetical protein